MKIFTTLFTLLFVIGCQQKQSFHISADSIPSREKHIILMHPTVNNVQTFEYLVKNNIFALPQGYKAIGSGYSFRTILFEFIGGYFNAKSKSTA